MVMLLGKSREIERSPVCSRLDVARGGLTSGLQRLQVARSMKRKERYIARPDEVKINREDDYAIIEYKEQGVPSTRLQIGPEIAGMSDEEIVELHNESLRAQAKRAAEHKHVAVEVPLGSAQIGYVARCDQLET
jgi:hypothetical protein